MYLDHWCRMTQIHDFQLNQYPPDFFEPTIHDTLTNIVSKKLRNEDKDENAGKAFLIFLQYRGNAASPRRETFNNCALLMLWLLFSVKWSLPWENWNCACAAIAKETCWQIFEKQTCVQNKMFTQWSVVGKMCRSLQARFKDYLRGGLDKEHLDKCIGGITVTVLTFWVPHFKERSIF